MSQPRNLAQHDMTPSFLFGQAFLLLWNILGSYNAAREPEPELSLKALASDFRHGKPRYSDEDGVQGSVFFQNQSFIMYTAFFPNGIQHTVV